MTTTLRTITVDGRDYTWWVRDDVIDTGVEAHVCVATSNATQQLRLDPYPWAQEIRPAAVADAIRFGLANGWDSEGTGEPLFVGLHRGALRVLPPGVRFVRELGGG